MNPEDKLYIQLRLRGAKPLVAAATAAVQFTPGGLWSVEVLEATRLLLERMRAYEEDSEP